MKLPSFTRLSTLAALAAAMGLPAVATAGPVFITGHDPDFHGPLSAGAANLLRTGLSYALGGTGNFNDNVHKTLWVESFNAPDGAHRIGEQGLLNLGLTLGQDFDWVNAAGFATANLSNYSAIGVASSFGGMFTSAELNAMILRSADIAAFINAGGGLFASAECDTGNACNTLNMTAPHGAMYGYLPVTVSSIQPTPPFHVTVFGAGLGLGDGDLNDPTHNSFGLIGGLNAVDLDSDPIHHATTLAGNVTIDDGGFHPTPEPGSVALAGLALAALGLSRRRRA